MILSGMITAGDRVDVVVIYTTREHGHQVSKSLTLLEHVQIFNTDNRSIRESTETDSKTKARVVGLLLTPEQVNYVSLAKAKGKIELSWRSRGDDAMANVRPVNQEALDELRGMQDWDNPLSGEGPSMYREDLASREWQRPGEETLTPPTKGGEDVNGFLNENEDATVGPAAPAQPVAVAPTEPPKPKWNVQIYVGNEAMTKEFELPEPPKAEEPAVKIDGSSLWDLFKQAT
jgi:Flp pilus assembly protein CpaB